MAFEMSRDTGGSALEGLGASAVLPRPQHELLREPFLNLSEPRVFRSVK